MPAMPHVRRSARHVSLVLCLLTLLLSIWPVRPLTPAAHAAPTLAEAGPEAVITGFTPTPAVRNGSHIFLASQGYGMESCSLSPDQSTTVLRSLALADGATTSLMEDCLFFQKGMVADSSFVFFRAGDNTLQRIPVGGGTAEILVEGTCCGGLALDSGYLYWGEDGAAGDPDLIRRVSKNGGSAETLASSLNPTSITLGALAVDATHVYWAEGGIGEGAIKAVPLVGGPIVTLADAGDGIDNARGIAIDADYVYWSEVGSGKIRRVSKLGGAVLDLAPGEQYYQAGALAVNDTHVFFADTNAGYGGRVRRVAKGGGPIDDLAIGRLGPGNVFLASSYVYWSEHGGLYRLPTGASDVSVDLTIERIEVNQGIQDLDNSVPLVAGKAALVRVYPRADLVATQARARLRVFRDGVEIPESPLLSSPETVLVRTSGAYRRDLDTTFNFWLWGALLDGNTELRAEINYDGAVVESNAANNSFSANVTFHAKKPICVEVVRVQTEPTTASANHTGFSEIVDWVRASYPTPDVLIDVGGEISETAAGAYEMPSDSSKVLNRLGWYRLWHNHNAYSECGFAHFYGMVHPDEMEIGGAGRLNNYVAWGVMNIDNAILGPETPEWYVPHGGASMAHELAHNRGRDHVDCGDPDDPDPNYPYDPCTLGPDELDAYFGYHLYEHALIEPADTGDLMSYSISVGKPRWVSDYTYRALYSAISNDLSGPAEASAVIIVPPTPQLVVSGYLTPTLGTAALEYGYQVPAALLSPDSQANPPRTPSTPSPYSLRLLGAGDSVLASKPLYPGDDQGDGAESQGFLVQLDFNAKTQAVAIFHNATELTRRAVSKNAPSVKVVTPNSGESLGGSMLIEWEAADADGDELTYTVQYSPDNGATWRFVGTGLTETSLTLDETLFLPGTDGKSGLIRVIASDGIRATTDVSDKPFSLRPTAPLAFISTPTDNAVFSAGDPIVLEGGAYDEEDGHLEGNALAWTIDGVAVGSGRNITVGALPVGKHTVTLTVFDSDKMRDSTSTIIYVRPQDCLAAGDKLDVVFIYAGDLTLPDRMALTGRIAQVMALLEEEHGIGGAGAPSLVRHSILCTTCAGNKIATIDPRTKVNNPGDWGAAVASVAAHFQWKQDYTRVIVPIHNGGPEDGNPLEDPGADRVAMAAAAAAANTAGVAVLPWLIMPVDTPSLAALLKLDADLAKATAGTHLPMDASNANVATALAKVYGRMACGPEADLPPLNGTIPPQTPLSIVGRNLWPGTQVLMNGKPVQGLTASPDGTLLRFYAPVGPTLAEAPVISIERPGAPPLAITNAEPQPPQPQRRSVYLPAVRR